MRMWDNWNSHTLLEYKRYSHFGKTVWQRLIKLNLHVPWVHSLAVNYLLKRWMENKWSYIHIGEYHSVVKKKKGTGCWHTQRRGWSSKALCKGKESRYKNHILYDSTSWNSRKSKMTWQRQICCLRMGDGRREAQIAKAHERTFPAASPWECSLSWLWWCLYDLSKLITLYTLTMNTFHCTWMIP